MRTTRRNAPNGAALTTGNPMKMKIVEILESRAKPLRVIDIVEITGISKSKVYQQIAQGKLPSVRIDGSIRVDPNHVIQWWKQHETGLPIVFDRSGLAQKKTASGEELERAV